MPDCVHYREEAAPPLEGTETAPLEPARVAWCEHLRSPVRHRDALALRKLLGCGGCLADCELPPEE